MLLINKLNMESYLLIVIIIIIDSNLIKYKYIII